MTRVAFFAGVLSVVTASAAGSPARGQDALPLVSPSAFREILASGPVSGTRSKHRIVDPLVGLRSGTPDGGFDAHVLRVAIGATPPAGVLCMKVLSRDGRYSASAQYRTSAATAPVPRVEAPTAYGDQLKAFRSTDMAVQLFMAPGCDSAKATALYAAVIGPPNFGDHVIVQVNAPASRVRAQFARGGQRLGESALCKAIDSGPRVGFTAECRLSIVADIDKGNVSLVLNETRSDGQGEQRTYPVVLQKPAN